MATAPASPLEAGLTNSSTSDCGPAPPTSTPNYSHGWNSELLSEVLRHTGNNQSEAARILGVTRKTLRTRMAALHLAVDHLDHLDRVAGSCFTL